MSQKQTVTINGREYDIRTGLPVTQQQERTSRAELRSTKSRSTTDAHAVHKKTQKSTTLNRKFTKKPVKQTQVAPKHTITQNRGARIDGIKPARRGVSSPALTPQKKQPIVQPIAQKTPALVHQQPQPAVAVPQHPAVAKAHKAQAAAKQPQVSTVPAASHLKQAAINEALENAPKHHAKQHRTPRSFQSRLIGAVFGCMALVLFGGYFTYLNVPNLSVRVAAAQAGIDASYPGYRPDGYRLKGPVAYSDGQVQMQFAANTGDTNFTLNQAKSSWDSSALLENYVRDQSNDEYSTSQEKGITIYNYGSNAAWVSGGILYTIQGDAPLSPDQIRKIATSV